MTFAKVKVSTGEPSIIGATTNNELEILEKDKAFTRRFVIFKLPYITIEEIKANISVLTTDYEVKISKEVTLEILNIIKNFYDENKILDVFLDTYDTICSAAKLQNIYNIKESNFKKFKWIVEELTYV